jgi:hypothetical protein
MRFPLPTLLALTLATNLATAQATDVGLTMDGGMLTVIFGQDCGTVPCTPFLAGPTGGGQPRNLVHYGAAQTLYVIAIGLPTPCIPIPGFDNALQLLDPIVLDFGLTTSPPFVPLPCGMSQGVANFQLVLPATVPAGITFRIQSLGVSGSGAFAFGPTLESTTV